MNLYSMTVKVYAWQDKEHVNGDVIDPLLDDLRIDIHKAVQAVAEKNNIVLSVED